MSTRLSQLARLSWRERGWLLQAVLLLPAIAIALRIAPARIIRALGDRPRGWRRVPIDRRRAERIAHMVAAAAQYGPYRATCLPQSIVLLWLLARDGMSGELRYGVRKDRTIAAHCWIELGGEPLIDSPAVHRHFAVLEPVSRWGR